MSKRTGGFLAPTSGWRALIARRTVCVCALIPLRPLWTFVAACPRRFADRNDLPHALILTAGQRSHGTNCFGCFIFYDNRLLYVFLRVLF